MKKKDLRALLSIEEASQLAPWSVLAFDRCFEAEFPGWVLEEEGKVIAFLIMSLATGESHILNLCVHPHKQRRGYGRQLLIHGLDWSKAQGAMVAYLEVRRSNLAAIEMYRTMKFKRIGERKDYYPTLKGREDALVFARDLGIE